MKTCAKFVLFLTLFTFSNCKENVYTYDESVYTDDENGDSGDPLPIQREIRLTEVGTGIPIAGAEVTLYDVWIYPKYPDLTRYTPIKNLGTTDADGVLRWEYFEGDLPASVAIGFTKEGYYHYNYIDNLQAYTLEGQLYPPGFVRFHLTFSPGAQQGRVYVHDSFLLYGDYYDFWEGGVFAGYPVNGVLDTVIQTEGAATHPFCIYVYEPPSLPVNSPYYVVGRTVYCPPHDTVLVEVVF